MSEIRLAPLGPEYLEAYYSSFTENVTRYQLAEPFRNAEETAAYFEKMKNMTEAGLARAYAILSDGNFCGSVEAHQLHTPIPDIGIWVKQEYRSKGIGAAALRLLTDELKSLGYTRFFYETDERNESSIRLAAHFHARRISGNAEEIRSASGKTLRLIRFTVF